MATINKALRFNNLTKKVSPYRGEVVQIGDGRVKVKRGSVDVWANTSLSLSVGDFVIVDNSMATQKLPVLPYAEVAVY